MAYRRSRHRRMSRKAGRRMTKRAGRVSRKVRRSRRVRMGGYSHYSNDHLTLTHTVRPQLHL